MQALYFDRHGGIENLKFGQLVQPAVGPGEALIRVGAAALNHLDLWVLNGWPALKLPLPHIGGSDIAGTIEQLGPDNHQFPFSIGDRVAVNPGIVGPIDEWLSRGEDSVSPGYKIIGEDRWGGFAEYVVVPAKNLYPIPADITFQQAASALLCSLTAWRMLCSRGGLKSGESVLVVGAGGGLNSITIQIARHLGATVYALSSSEKKLDQAAKLGAQYRINYRSTPDWSKEILNLTNGRGIDLIIDNVGATTFPQSLRSAVRGGRIVTVGNTAGPTLAIDNRYIFGKQLSIIGSTMGSRADFESVLPLIWNKTIVAPIDRELLLKDGIEGYRAMERGEQFGKIVLIP